MQNITKSALTNSLAITLYVILVASLMFTLSNSNFKSDNTIIFPIAMLLLLVFSVALVGVLIFGRPILLYIDKKKKEAVSLLAQTLIILFAIIILIFLLMLAIF